MSDEASITSRVIVKVRLICHGIAMRRIYKKFGRMSSVLKPRMLTNPMFVEIGDNVGIGRYSRIEVIVSEIPSPAPVLRIGDWTHIEEYFHVAASNLVEIGKSVLIASRVYITDHNHRFTDIDTPIRSQGIESKGPVIIGDNAWLGEGCAILPGVKIGRNAVVGANAVVTSDVPAYCVVAGIPARVIKRYDFDLNDWVRDSG